MSTVVSSVLAGLLGFAAFAQEPSAKGVNFYSLAQEAALGQQAAASLIRELPIIHEPKLDAYIARLASELEKYADHQFTYSFTVYEDRRPLAALTVAMALPVDALQGRATEPVALAGGPIFVPLSLLASAPNEAEFAFQLAHAMAHIALRHSTRLATRQEIAHLSRDGLPAEMASRQESMMQLGFLKFARQFELEADIVATRVIAGAGYDPASVIPYLDEASVTPRVFSAHPSGAQRVETIRARLEKLPSRAYAASTGEFDEIQALVASVR